MEPELAKRTPPHGIPLHQGYQDNQAANRAARKMSRTKHHRFAILSCAIQRLDEMQRILFHEPFKCLPSEITAANCNEE